MRNSQQHIELQLTSCPDYALLDSGDGMKLENFGGRIIVRPEPKAWWKKALPESFWVKNDASFDQRSGKWQCKSSRIWHLNAYNLKFELRLNDNSKHVGIFPEQEPHWEFISNFAKLASGKNLLNMFGYTGVASVFALKAGFSVTHLDASGPSIAWAKRNAELNDMSSKPIRWILDDAMNFTKREIRRCHRYDAIILDPPAFGRGPKGEIWKLEHSLPELLSNCAKLLSDDPLFIILTIYNLEASSIMPANLMREIFPNAAVIRCGELGIKQKDSEKILPLSIFTILQICNN